jgi:hypothetical protein
MTPDWPTALARIVEVEETRSAERQFRQPEFRVLSRTNVGPSQNDVRE